MANSPGDFTGKQKEKLAEKHAQEQAQRAQEVSMITAQKQQRKEAEVVDYTKTKEPPPPPDTGPVDLTQPQEVSEERDETIERIVGSAAKDADPEAVSDQPVDTTVEPPPTPEPVRVERTNRTIRARYDLPQVTIGKGTFYDFEAGRKYIVTQNVATHLEERDLVDVLD